ncbi:MAG: GAF domain-containing protein [Deltaproteobacteria bacterium]|nr:GAF domain-containing protein [Deltaproteobacteria bacterium]
MRRGLRLRHKLALSFSIAALLPVAVASTMAVKIVLESLEQGLREQTARQLRIAMNLVLRNVERLGDEAVQLAGAPALAEAIGNGEGAVAELLARSAPHLPSALVQVTDARGQIMATHAVAGNRERFAPIAVDSGGAMVKRGLSYERRVTIAQVGDVLVVRAVAPVVDPSFSLFGIVLMSLPLDGDFADGIKGALGADVLIHAAARPAMSSFLDSVGGRAMGIEPPSGIAVDVLAGGTRFTRGTIADREHALGYAPLKNLDGEHVGMLGIAVGRGSLLAAKRAAARSLVLGATGAFVFALVIAGLLSRRLTRPIARLHEGALAVARGDLELSIAPIEAGDEIGDLAAAFATMTAGLRENQERLAARMREIMALHEAGHAISSVLGLEEVLRKIVDSVAKVAEGRLVALWLVDPRGVKGDEPRLKVGAARAKPTPFDLRRTLDGAEAVELAEKLCPLAAEAMRTRSVLRVERVEVEPRWREVAQLAQVAGPLLAVPLQRMDRVVGVLVVGRHVLALPFTDSEANLIQTFADQATTAIENARLYEEVRAFSEELEEKVRLRTAELTAINAELGRALSELRETQAQLLLSERLAGLGTLVAGVAHEINSPTAAIRGSVDALVDNVQRLAQWAQKLAALPVPEEKRKEFLALMEEISVACAERRMHAPADVRRISRELATRLGDAGVGEGRELCARALAHLGAEDWAPALAPLLVEYPPEIITGYLQEHVYLHRNTAAIRSSTKQIQRIVGALKGYSHLDQAKIEQVDIHEGIENTLVILHHELKYGISIVRKYGQLPRIPVYVDELNQVWTNLLHNAAQALAGKGEIVIQTDVPCSDAEGGTDGMVAVRVMDNGPGVPAEILPRIFEPFFTTKSKGEGTGLGLGIAQRIVDKHGGRVEVESRPGHTSFTVFLPLSGPSRASSSPVARVAGEELPHAKAAQGGVVT